MKLININQKRRKMNTYRMNAVMTGTLYFLGTVFGVLGALIGGEVFISLISSKPPAGVDMLSLVAANSPRLAGGALFTLMMGISLAAMTAFLYPIIRKDSEELATGMVLFRGALEGTWYFVTALGFFAMVALGNEYTAAGADSAALQSIGNILYQFQDRLATVGPIFFYIGAACLYISFYRTRLIPRWLSAWGLIGVVTSCIDIDTGYGFYLEMVLASQEMVMAVWLIAKGFNPSAIASLSAKTK
jgi:hypothetical protein